jgi:hypothetical protein
MRYLVVLESYRKYQQDHMSLSADILFFGRGEGGEGVNTTYHQGLSHSLCLNLLKRFIIYLGMFFIP